MALFEVYYRGPHGTAIGERITTSEANAIALVEELIAEGKEAWYEQIQ